MSFKFGRADVPQVGVAPFAVVELLQISKNGCGLFLGFRELK